VTKKILSEEQMVDLLESVAADLTNAKLYLYYSNQLDDLLNNKYPEVRWYSNTFWDNTKKVYYDAMAMCLIRVYDQHPKSVGLKKLLSRINENMELFKNRHTKNFFDEVNFKNQIEKDMGYVNINHKKNMLVKDLDTIRKYAKFHKSEDILLKEKPDVAKTKISHEEITQLIDEGLEKLKYYFQAFDISFDALHTHEYRDHEIIFITLQKYHNSLIASLPTTPPLSYMDSPVCAISISIKAKK
jgi:hypothetical protein